MDANSVYSFSYTPINASTPVELASYQGKVLLIVNTASACGFTPQYKDLQALYEEFQGKLVVIGFPCNQFGAQETGEAEEIKQFCDLNFHVSFPLSQKVEVNGPNAHPLFTYLKKELPGLLGTKDIKWNFTKFLIDQKGKAIDRFAPTTSPLEIRPLISKLLQS